MKHPALVIFSLVLTLVAVGIATSRADAASLASRLSGRLLLPVSGQGELWYVYPKDLKRYILEDPGNAFVNVLSVTVEVTDKVLAGIPTAPGQKGNAQTIREYAGQFLHNPVGGGDRLWYVDPVQKRRFWFDGSQPSFDFLHSLALGISDKNLALIKPQDAYVASMAYKKEMGALVTAAESCQPLKKTIPFSFSIFKGVKQTSVGTYEIVGPVGAGCQARFTYTDEKATFDSTVPVSSRQAISKSLAYLKGRTGLCTYDSAADLAQILGQWQQGQFSTSDSASATCSGNYFGDN